MSEQPISESPSFANVDEAAAYWAARMAQKPITPSQRERLISLLLD